MENRAARARSAVESWKLGETSRRYESAGSGAGTISRGHGDHGGVSYGTYQLSSRTGTLHEYLAQSRYGVMFHGLAPATPDFDRRWQEIAAKDPAFGQDQHEFIRRSHYGIEMERLRKSGLDLEGRGRAVKDAVWSTAVQFRSLTRPIFERGIEEKFGQGYRLDQLSDADIVTAVQDYKLAHNATLFNRSPALWPGLMARAASEKVELLELCENERIAGLLPSSSVDFAYPAPKDDALAKDRQPRGAEAHAVGDLQALLNYRRELPDRPPERRTARHLGK